MEKEGVNTETDVKKNNFGWCRLTSSGSGQGKVADCCGHGDELYESIYIFKNLLCRCMKLLIVS
jgi:hypothetical protein